MKALILLLSFAGLAAAQACGTLAFNPLTRKFDCIGSNTGGSGITSLNGLTSATQTFATPGTSGTAPAWTSSGTAHTLNIPLASASGVTAGLLPKSFYDTILTAASAGNSGGIPYFSAASRAMGSSAAWTVNTLMKGGGAGASPVVTGITVDSSDNVSTPGSISAGAGGSAAGYFECTQGTAPSNGTTSIRIYCDTAVTSYRLRLPAAAATGIPYITNTSNDAVMSVLSTPLSNTYGGTNNAFFAVSGPASSTRTFTFPNASATVLTDNAAVTVPQGGTGAATFTANLPLFGNGSSAFQSGTVQGNTTKVVTYAGSAPATNDCAKFDSNGNLTTAGAACGSGSGSASAGSPLFVQTASVTVTNTGSETSLDGTVAGSKTIPVNWFTAVGTVLRVCFGGYLSADAVTPGTIRLKMYFGATAVADTGAVTLPAAIPANTNFSGCVDLTARTVGASGTIMANSAVDFGQALAGLGLGFLNTSAVTIDTTATQAFTFKVTWGTADTDNSITLTNLWAASPGSAVSSVFGQTGAVGNLSGDATTSGSSAVTVAKINGATLGTTTATDKNLLIANGTSWVTQAMSGDVTIGNTGVTAIGATKVTNAMLAGSIDLTTKVTGALPAANMATAVRDGGFGVTFDGGGGALTGGTTTARYVTLPAACTIVAWDIMVDAGTATFKTWRVASGSAIPTNSDSISTAGVAISSGTAVHSTTVSDWTDTTLDANDIIGLNLSAVATATVATFQVTCRK